MSSSADDELETCEQELTRDVPLLLDSMNSMSTEVNMLERQVSEAQARHKQLLEQWSRLYEDLRAQHGSAIDRVKPYFDAAQLLNAASQRVQGVVRAFSAAASQHTQAKAELRTIEERLAYGAHKVQLDPGQQDGLSRATVRVLQCQQERDVREQEYARALRDYQEAQEALEAWRMQIGDSTIKRVLPCFKQLQQHQVTLAQEQNHINTCAERARCAKNKYHNSLRELDRINVAVHEARRDRSAVLDSTPEAAPEETPPEIAPEAEGDLNPRKVALTKIARDEGIGNTTAMVPDDGPFA